MQKILEISGIIAMIFVMLGVTAHSNFAFNEDLGRHIKLGEIIWETKSVPTTNLFTYTNTDFPFINHHWLSEVIFFLLNTYAGAFAISILKIGILVITALLVFKIALAYTNFFWSIVSFTILFPLLTLRTDERPEMSGFLFFALTFLLLFGKEKTDKKCLLFLPFVFFLWINMHLNFIYGVFLLGMFFLKNVWLFIKEKVTRDDFLFFFGISFASVLALFLNPNGVRGVLYPFTIFQNYGYMIIENQTVFFLLSRISNKLIPYFLVIAPIVIVAIIIVVVVLFRKKNKSYLLFTNYYLLFIIALVFSILSFLAFRNFPFFALSAIPAFSIGLSVLLQPFVSKRIILTFTAIMIILNLFVAGWFVLRPSFSLATAENYKRGVDFFLQNKLSGNIFNNFDIGGYLDYRLYPEYRTFVDNRPEAFPETFFETYRQIQTDVNVRRIEFAKYNINSIIFAHTDITPWAQEFLRQIAADNEWKAVYFDSAVVIFVKRGYPLPEIPLEIS